MIYRDCIYILFTVFAFCFLPSFHSRMKWMESQSHQRRKRWEQMKERKNLTFTQRGHPPPIALMSSVETTGSDYCPWTTFLKTLFCGWNAIRGAWFGSSREVAFPLQWHITGTHRLSVYEAHNNSHIRAHILQYVVIEYSRLADSESLRIYRQIEFSQGIDLCIHKGSTVSQHKTFRCCSACSLNGNAMKSMLMLTFAILNSEPNVCTVHIQCRSIHATHKKYSRRTLQTIAPQSVECCVCLIISTRTLTRTHTHTAHSVGELHSASFSLLFFTAFLLLVFMRMNHTYARPSSIFCAVVCVHDSRFSSRWNSTLFTFNPVYG